MLALHGHNDVAGLDLGARGGTLGGYSHHDDLAPIRESVRALCADFPGEYWRRLDRERAYPEEFVTALTKAGFLAALYLSLAQRLI